MNNCLCNIFMGPCARKVDGLAVTTHCSCPRAPVCTDNRGGIFPETGGRSLSPASPAVRLEECTRMLSSQRLRCHRAYDPLSTRQSWPSSESHA